MSRVLVLTSLIAVVGLATPAVADGGGCSQIVIAFTESEEVEADIYVSQVVEYHGGPEPDVADLHLTLLEAVEEFHEPGEVSRGKYIVQINLQLPYHEDPEVSGVRLTYAVDAISCTGL